MSIVSASLHTLSCSSLKSCLEVLAEHVEGVPVGLANARCGAQLKQLPGQLLIVDRQLRQFHVDFSCTRILNLNNIGNRLKEFRRSRAL
jgi:hypothetical protein